MPTELKIPSFGESITEAYLGDWLKTEGEKVGRDEPVVVLETDKVTAELPAPVSGTITKVLKKKGDTAEIGEVIGYIEEGEVSQPNGDPGAIAETAAREGAAGKSREKPEKRNEAEGSAAAAHVMPAARRLLDENDVDPAAVRGTGPGGRVLKEDVLRHLEGRETGAAPRAEAPAPRAQGERGGASRATERVPMSRLRLKIAERLVSSQQTMALLTTFNEIDMGAVMALRTEHKESFVERHGVKLGFMSFFVKAAVDALKLIPQVNGRIDGDEIIYHEYQDIGIAVGGGRGLVVPVIRNAERLSFADVELTITDFAKRAQENRLELDELQGGTFTISNGGVYGSMMSTPIVNPPQSAILGLHAIQERPVGREGRIELRPMMYVALTYDHRIIDGREAVTFLRRIKECVENPSRILLEI